MIEARGLTRHFGAVAALRDLSLRAARGEVFGLLGPNGAGKTTAIRLLMGFLVPGAGSATIDGLDCHRDRVEVKRRVGYVPDVPVFHEHLRGREIVEFVAAMHGLDALDASRRTARLLGELGLGEAGEHLALSYSLGMKKALALACALVHEPPALILDEPTNGLDPRAARRVRDHLRAFADGGGAVLLSTHLLDTAERLCDRVAIVHRGALVAEGTPAALRERVVAGGTLEEVFLQLTAEGSPAPESGS